MPSVIMLISIMTGVFMQIVIMILYYYADCHYD